MSTENVHLLELSWKGEEFLNPKEAKKKKRFSNMFHITDCFWQW